MPDYEEEAGERLWRHIAAHTHRTEEDHAGPGVPHATPASEDEELMSLANVVRGFLDKEAGTPSGKAAARARLIEEIRADQLLRSQPQTPRSPRRPNPAFAWGRTLVLLALLLALLAAVAAGVAAWSAHQDHCALQSAGTPLYRAALQKTLPASASLPPPCHGAGGMQPGIPSRPKEAQASPGHSDES